MRDDVRPIIAKQCAVCHRPGGEGPFRLDRASDLAARRQFAAAVIEQGVMPPWLPQSNSTAIHGRGPLEGPERTLLLEYQVGAPHDENAEPAVPVDPDEDFEDSDLLEIEPGFDIPAESLVTLHSHTHNTRTFALPLVNDEPLLVTGVRWVSPPLRTPFIQSCALISIPPVSDIADSLELPAGYHMSGDLGARPAGGLGVLGVGDRTVQYPEGYAYEIPEGSTIVTEMSYRPTGRDVPVEATVDLQLAHPDDELEAIGQFPGDEAVSGCRRASAGAGRAGRSDGSRCRGLESTGGSLSEIDEAHGSRSGRSGRTVVMDYPDWDMHWRSTHVLKSPMRIKAGTRLLLDVDVDNSDDNPRNLNYPLGR